MDSSNCQTTMPKVLPNQPLFCPWTSKAPLASSLSVRSGSKPFEQQTNSVHVQETSVNCHHTIVDPSCSSDYQGNGNGLLNITKPTALRYPSIQQSSTQFFNFLRLMQLFPDVHPATLHTVLILCKSDLFCAVDKLLYAKRCKQLYNSRRNIMKYTSASKCNRHQPFCYSETSVTNNRRYDSKQESVTVNCEMPGPIILQGVVNQMGPLDASVKKIHINQGQLVNSGSNGNEKLLKASLPEPGKFLLRNRLKSKDKLVPSSALAVATDFPSAASIQCKLPIRPLSPIAGVPEDLSNQSGSSASTSYNYCK